MSHSLSQFVDRQKAKDGDRIYWGRAAYDGLPLKSRSAPPVMSDEEFQQFTYNSGYFFCEFFNMDDKVQRETYERTWTAIVRGWYKLVHITRFWNNTNFHYLEWVERYKELDPNIVNRANQ